MKRIFFKLALFTAITFSATAFLSSCDKDDETTTDASADAKAYFTTNMLNRELVVPLAVDNSTDVTAKFDGFTFTFVDTTTYAGTATASNGILTVRGTWGIDAAYDKITFSLPTNIIADIAFMNKEWKFTNRDSATVKLNATAESDILHFKRK